jgi:hypothetical protein
MKWSKMEDPTERIHTISMKVMYVALVINLLNVSYDIFAIARPDIVVGAWVGIMQIVISTIGSILFGLSTTITALYGSRTLGKLSSGSMVEELVHRYQHTNIKEEALRVNRIMEEVDLPQSSSLYQDIHSFKGAIRDHMLTRKGLSGLLNILASIFLYYNILTFLILYGDIITLEASSTRLLYLMLNVVNPIICLLISYLVVLCDNFNSIAIYSHRVSELLQIQNEQLPAITNEIKGYVDRIEQPLYRQMWFE